MHFEPIPNKQNLEEILNKVYPFFLLFKGKKGPGDKRLDMKCSGCGGVWTPRFIDWLAMARIWGDNEDLLYPLEYQRGRNMLVDLLADGFEKKNGTYRYTLAQLCKKYKIPEK